MSSDPPLIFSPDRTNGSTTREPYHGASESLVFTRFLPQDPAKLAWELHLASRRGTGTVGYPGEIARAFEVAEEFYRQANARGLLLEIPPPVYPKEDKGY